jgi:predicted ATPase
LHIPASLHESLLARLDRAGEGRALAQIASVIGRSVPREHLIRVAQWDEDVFEAALERLVQSDLFHVEIAEGSPAYVFRHALVQDAAYNSLLRDRRRELHATTAAVLADLRPEIAEQQPELLAHHLTEANLSDEAVSYWLRAGQRDVARSALQEAMAHLGRGLSVLDTLSQTPLNLDRRLQFLALLGPVLIALKGPGSAEVEDAYAIAFDICRRIPETKGHFAINWGWWRLSRNFTAMRQRSRALLEQAQARQDDELLLQAHHCEWASHFNQGDLRACCEHIESGLSIYTRGDFRSHATLYGNHDAKVCGHGEHALVLWMQGHPDRALEEERKSLAWANELMHSGSLAHANDIALMHRFYRRDAAAVLSRADAMISFAEDRGFSDHRAKALIFRGWAMAQMGDPASGLETLEAGLARQKDIGTIEDFPPFFCMYAETLMLCGRPEAALNELRTGRELFSGVELKIWEPEVCRCMGELLRLTAPHDTRAAEQEFVLGLESARAQGAHGLALRSATGLARLWKARGEGERAVALLTESLTDRDPAGNPEAQEAAELLVLLSAAAPVLAGKRE